MRARYAHAACVLGPLGALLLGACAPLAVHDSRAARSSTGCMHAALSGYSFDGREDSEAHCLAVGLIAWRCSPTEAVLAGAGKELKDVVGPGDASLGDLRADRRGLECAQQAGAASDIERCCARP